MQQNWKELADLTGYEVEKLYQSVRQEALRELAFQELAVTRILKDLIEIRKHSPRHADLLTDAAGLPFSSYEELGDRHRITKQGVYSIMKRYAKSYGWIEGIMQIRAIRNTRGVPDPESRRRIASWREKRQTKLHRGK